MEEFVLVLRMLDRRVLHKTNEQKVSPDFEFVFMPTTPSCLLTSFQKDIIYIFIYIWDI